MKKDSTNTRRAERKARAGMASNAAELQSYSGRKRTTGPQREQKGRTGYYQGRREKGDTPTPTRFGLNSASIIDYALIKNLNWPSKTENLYLHKASSTSEIENEVRELTSEILTAHGNASKPVTHSEVPFVQGELKHLFKERTEPEKSGNSLDTHKIKLL
ncbi:hypothetical protein TNCV_4236841 [Trichonephila clavipes]|nr:hypothetical protein TNCV_4236841 [Trichonephila clavipes]